MKSYEEYDRMAKSDGRTECSGVIHVVQPGDTLYGLSKKYHVSVSDIMYKNPYANVYHLRAGDELCMPVAGRRGK